ncbi:hypothetical protein [Streptomyces flavidovirens]|uniref:hypothetical protein n=1 Tax=Streptomyces flavidovirens TaxID=67298 RepID=UPI003678D406
MAQPVPFQDTEHTQRLSTLERAALLLLHPEGRAPFWGVSSYHDKRAAKLKRGNIVLFTGQGRVFAAGEIGAVLRNGDFADLLWPPGTNEPGWQNVYSLLSVEPTDIPYPELARLCGYKPNYGFPGAVFLEGEDAQHVLDGLHISPAAHAPANLAPPDRATVPASAPAPVSFIVPVERYVTASTSYQRESGTTLVDRQEGRLVGDYLATLGQDVATGRLRTPVGPSDILTVGPTGRELIEAKGRAEHFYVRQALGQLLDYVAHSPEPVDRLAALFPERPAPFAVALLHRYGIDCVYRDGDGSFERLPTTEARRHAMRHIWSSSAP